MSAVERLIRYCRIDTQSDETCSDVTPSTEKQFDLANMLVEELKELGLEDAFVDEHCYVYAHLPANCETSAKTVAFIAHMDTSPDYCATGVNPVLIENYDGNDIELSPGVVTKVADFPQLAKLKGDDLVVTDGSTLLGADDKAGIAAIMDTLEYYKEHPEEKHGTIAVAFTPDEEIGNGPKYFRLDCLKADFGYTLDGGEVDTYTDETFNAAAATVDIQGFTIHPGTAKNKMINSMNVAHEFHGMLPAAQRPEYTEGFEGFYHLVKMSGDCDHTVLEYILRDHNLAKLEEKMELVKAAASYLNTKYGEGTVSCRVEMSYRNMKEIIDQHPEVSQMALDSIRDLGYEPAIRSARGGTDGATISFMGMPCPNIGTGGGNAHGRYEYCSVKQLNQVSELVRKIAKRTLEEAVQ